MDSDNVGALISAGQPCPSISIKSIYCFGVFGWCVLSICYSLCTGSFCISLCIVKMLSV